LVVLLSGLFLVVSACRAKEINDGMPEQFRTGFMECTFQSYDIRDARAILEMNAKEAARLMDLNVPTKVNFFSDTEAMIMAIRKGELELFTLPAIEYLNVRDKKVAIPIFVNGDNNGNGIQYLLITRKDSGIRSFSDLKGKSLMLPPICYFKPGHLWLDVLLLKEKKEDLESFFSAVQLLPRSSNATLGVFFRKADAALVTRQAFEINLQLNPQLEQNLTILAQSPFLLNEVICLAFDSTEYFRNRITNALLKYNESKAGQQLFTIFKNAGILPFKPTYSEGLENLIAEQNQLKTKETLKK